MKILRVIGSMDPASGGPCQGIRNSVEELEKLGVQNEVVCLDDPSAPFLTRDPFTIHALGRGKSPWHYAAELAPWLTDNVDRFDFVIVHGLWLYQSFAVNRVLKRLKNEREEHTSSETDLPKLFVMPHGMLDPWFQEAAGRRMKAIRNSIYWQLIEKNVVNEADGMLFTCEEELLLARKTFPEYRPKHELNVGYGIAPPPAHGRKMTEAFRKVCPRAMDGPYLLFLSRIHEKKGVDLLIRAYLSLKKEKARLPALVIAGPGMDSQYGKNILDLASGDETIIFPGMLTGDAKWGAFYGCEAFVLPSHQENFGIAVVEAMACGRSVLISDQVNIYREIANCGGGIVSEDTESGVIGLISKWIALPIEQKAEMGSRAMTCYHEHFTIQSAVFRLMKALVG